MRARVSIVIALFTLSAISKASDVNNKTICALEHIGHGYIKFGFDELQKSAATNDMAAQFYVAACYEYGFGTEKDMVKAFKMYRKVAERGLPDAMYRMALYYKNGIVVSPDILRENEWIHRFNQRGGKMILPDILSIYNEGMKYPENYALNPQSSNDDQSNLLAQNSWNITSRSNIINNITIAQKPQGDILQIGQNTDESLADVDKNIPISQLNQNNTFVIIIANETYQDVEDVPNARNDGIVFAKYCEKTLGIPVSNIKLIKDATLNGIRRQLVWVGQVMEAYKGDANVIFYYAGHGIPDEGSRSAYLLPVDGFGSDVSTGYSLDKLYAELGSKPAKSVVVLLDACFSGARRDGGMLASARGVAIKPKQNEPKGNMVVISAAQGDETAYPYKEKGHGMFTYFLLKKLQETKGDVTYGELADYITSEVRRHSIVINGKMQTPTATASGEALDWRIWKFGK